MRTEKGFSLVEMIVVMVILSIVLLIVSQFITNQGTILRKQQLVANTQQNLRVAGEQITKDVEMACLNPARLPGLTFAFKVYQGNQVDFTMDLNANATMDGMDSANPRRDEYRGFFLQGPDPNNTYTLMRARNAAHTGSVDVATGIDSIRFWYFTKDSAVVPYGSLNDTMGIARVRFLVYARSATPYRMQPLTYVIRTTESWVAVRNRAF